MGNTVFLSQPLIPVNTSVDAKVDGGTYTYVVSGPPQGQALSVTISVPGAPQASSWSVTGAWRGSMQGTNSFGPLYLTAGGSLTVTGSSVSDPGPLQVTGVQGPLGSLQPSTPTSVGPSVEVGTVDATVTGTVDANITNASIPVTGTVDANITNATLTVDGTVSLTADQVVEVTNQAGGSLTVAGTVDANVQNATIDVSGSTVNIGVITGEPVASIVSPATSVTVTTTADINSLLIKSLPGLFTVSVTGAAVGSVPCNPTPNSDGNTYTWVASLPSADTWTVALENIVGSYLSFEIYTSSGIEHVEVSLVSPFDQGGLPTTPLRQTDFYLMTANNPLTLVLEEPSYITLALSTASNYVTSMVDSLGRPVPYELVQLTGTSGGPVYLITNPGGDEITVNLAASDGATVAVFNGRPPTVKLPVQTVSVPEPAAGADWSFTLPYAARVVSIRAVLTTSSSAGSRYPLYKVGQLGPENSVAPSGGLGPSDAVWLNAWPGPPMANAIAVQSDNQYNGTFPDLGILSAGEVVNSRTPGLQSADQWSAIGLYLEPA